MSCATAVVSALMTLSVLDAPPVGEGRRSVNPTCDSSAPRPVVAWPSGPLEVRVAFDRPIDAVVARALVGRSIPFGERAKPVGKVAEVRLSSTLGALRIAAAHLDDRGSTLILATDPHPREATYLLTLPGVRSAGKARPEHAKDVVLAYDLNGVEATWDHGPDAAQSAGSGWWPQIDTEQARALVAGSAEHERSFELLSRPGRLSLRTFIRLPEGKATVRLESDVPLESTLASEAPTSTTRATDRHRSEWVVESKGDTIELAATIATGVKGKTTTIRTSYQLEGDSAELALPRAWQVVPWAPPAPASLAPPAPLPFPLAGGDRRRGEAIFASDEAKCLTCHKVGGRGGDVGPDLSSLNGRDPAEVYREIAEPSASIKPDYIPFTVALKNGRVAVGVVRAEGAGAIRVLDNGGKATLIPRSEIDELRASSTSIMPVGVAGALGAAKMRDLLTFLLTPAAEKP